MEFFLMYKKNRDKCSVWFWNLVKFNTIYWDWIQAIIKPWHLGEVIEIQSFMASKLDLKSLLHILIYYTWMKTTKLLEEEVKFGMSKKSLVQNCCFIKFQALGFGLTQCHLLQAFGEYTSRWKSSPSLSLPLCLYLSTNTSLGGNAF